MKYVIRKLLIIGLFFITHMQCDNFFLFRLQNILNFKKLKNKKRVNRFYHYTISDFYYYSKLQYFSENTKLLFSPNDSIADHLIFHINKETKSIKIAVFILSNNKLVESLISAVKRGVSVEVIVDKSSLDKNKYAIDCLKDNGINVSIYDKSDSFMHHKIILFESEVKVGFGSYNFSKRADNQNCENFVITDHEEIIKKFLREFERIRKIIATSL